MPTGANLAPRGRLTKSGDGRCPTTPYTHLKVVAEHSFVLSKAMHRWFSSWQGNRSPWVQYCNVSNLSSGTSIQHFYILILNHPAKFNEINTFVGIAVHRIIYLLLYYHMLSIDESLDDKEYYCLHLQTLMFVNIVKWSVNCGWIHMDTSLTASNVWINCS